MRAKQSELKKVEECIREKYEFAHAKCPVCGADFVLYPKED
ncbi:hypothetical protein [Bremerella sp. P1]|nr:hypothetical protein [Bremerella sp. P1]WDI44797.1 hypothetical protein PSR63_12710 [Bremerella sp. P1]